MSSISTRWEVAEPRRPWRTSNQLRRLSASGSAASAPVRTCELRPRMGELIPGVIVEQVAGREGGVEVDDMDVAAGDHLQLRVISPGAGDGRTECRSRDGLAVSHTGGDTVDQLGERLRDFATVHDGQRFRGEHAPCRPVGEVSAGQQHGVGGDAGPHRQLGVTEPDPPERSGQERRRFPDVAGNDVDQRLRPCRAGVLVRVESRCPGALEEVSSLRSVTGDELGPSRFQKALSCAFRGRS